MTDHGPGAIPERPLDPVEIARLQAAAQANPPAQDPRLQPVAPAAPGTHVGYPTPPREEPLRPAYEPTVRKTRAQILAQRRAEREAGVDFFLENTGIMARVRDLPLTDRVMLRGVPAEMRKPIQAAIDAAQQLESTNDLSKAMEMLDMESELSDVSCWVGFLWPRLARTEAERVRIMHETDLTDDEVLLLSDLHPDEKAAYRDFVFRDRDGSEEDVARIAQFQRPGAEVASVPDREDSAGPERGSLADAPDDGEWLLTGGTARAG